MALAADLLLRESERRDTSPRCGTDLVLLTDEDAREGSDLTRFGGATALELPSSSTLRSGCKLFGLDEVSSDSSDLPSLASFTAAMVVSQVREQNSSSSTERAQHRRLAVGARIDIQPTSRQCALVSSLVAPIAAGSELGLP